MLRFHLRHLRLVLVLLVSNRLVRLRNQILPSCMLSRGDLPEIKLLEEVDLVVGVNELWEDLSIVSQVVNQELESLSITIEEYLIIDFLQFMQTIKHFLKS